MVAMTDKTNTALEVLLAKINEVEGYYASTCDEEYEYMEQIGHLLESYYILTDDIARTNPLPQKELK